MWRCGLSLGCAAILTWGFNAGAESGEVSSASPPPAKEWRRNALSIEPLPTATGKLRGMYERALTSRWSAVLATTLFVSGQSGAATQGTSSEGLSTSAFGIGAGPGVQYFFTGQAPEGLWTGARLDFIYELKTFSQQLEGQGLPPGGIEARSFGGTFAYGGSVGAGYTATFGSGFLVQLGGELGLLRQTRPSSSVTAQTDEAIEITETQLTTTEFALRPRVGIGYTF